MRLDADVIAWLKKQGKGYQTRANSILRQRMLDELRRAWECSGTNARGAHDARVGTAGPACP